MPWGGFTGLSLTQSTPGSPGESPLTVDELQRNGAQHREQIKESIVNLIADNRHMGEGVYQLAGTMLTGIAGGLVVGQNQVFQLLAKR